VRSADALLARDLRPAPLLHRPAVIVSLLLHLVAFFAFLGLPRLLGRSASGSPIYVVDLVALPGGSETPGPAATAPAPAPPTPAPKTPPPAPPKAAPKPLVKPEPPRPKPVERPIVLPDRGAKKKKEKPEPPKTALPKPTESQTAGTAVPSRGKEAAAPSPSPAPSAPAAASSGGAAAGTGPAGAPGTGAQGPGTSDVYSFYIALLDRTIRNAWSRPVYTGKDVKTALVRLQLSPTGRVVRLELATASGFDPLDRSALRAVRDAEPFPPFPASLGLDSLTVPIEFQLTPEGSPDEPAGP